MNTVEERKIKNYSAKLLASELTNASDSVPNATLATEAPLYSSTGNLSVIGTIVKTALTMQDIVTEEPVHHMFYIYIWGAAILGCILLTTGR